jgi:hypothetical protein
MGAASIGLAQQQTPVAPTTNTLPDQTTVKIEALTTIVASLGEMVKLAIQPFQPQQAGPRPRGTGVNAIGASGGTSVCNFCGLPGHFIWEYETVAEYTRAGKCKRNPEGRVVLPAGSMVLRSITGTWLRDRIDEYHRQNPGQMAAQMLFEVAAYASVPPIDAAGQSYYSYPTRHVNQYFGENPARTYALNWSSRLRPEVVITTWPPRSSGCVGLSENAGGAPSEEAP